MIELFISQDVFDKLEKEKEKAFAAYMKLANELSTKRKNSFSELESMVMLHCKDLMFENARFKIYVLRKGNLLVMVLMRFEFLVSMNPGQDFSSLSVSASGWRTISFDVGIKSGIPGIKGN